MQIRTDRRGARGRWLLAGVVAALVGAVAGGLWLGRTGSGCSQSLCASAATGTLTGPVPADFYGVNADLAFSPASPDWDASAAQIAQLGGGMVRRDAYWAAIEPIRPRRAVHRYRWRATDRLVEALAKSGLQWYPIVDYSAAWAGATGVQSPPTSSYVKDYAAFAGALARRYGVRGRFWRQHRKLRPEPVQDYEIWNEPNVPRFWPQQSYAPQRLAAMYIAAQARIKAVDPSARVVLGGLSVIGVEGFLARMVQVRPLLASRLEAVGFHPYGGGANGGLQTTYERIRTLRATLSRLIPGRSVPMEITETGWAVPWVPESWRSQRLQQLAIELPRSNCNVSRFIVYSWTSTYSGPSPEDYFGIAHVGGALTESALALRTGIASTRQPGSAGVAHIC
jgi:hypothetical protein